MVDAGYFPSKLAGRMGRGCRLPSQLGHWLCKILAAQSAQKVHSKLQITASVEEGGRALPQFSQQGRSWSILQNY